MNPLREVGDWRSGQGRSRGSFVGRGRGVGVSVGEAMRKEFIPKQNSFVPTSSASNLEYVPTTVLVAGCVKQGNAWQAPAISKVNNRESEERRRNIDSADGSEIRLNYSVYEPQSMRGTVHAVHSLPRELPYP